MAYAPTDPKSYTVRLANVKAAIDEICSGVQSTSYEGRSMSMANLAELRALEREYEALAAGESATINQGRNRISYFTPVT